MKVYIRFLSFLFLKSFILVFAIMLSLVFILNILSEIDFFKNLPVEKYYPIYIALLNSPSLIFEMFPYIFLISTQLFFINLFNNNEIQIFKYSGLKNINILAIIGFITFLLSIFIIFFYYSFSSTFKKYYLEIKNQYSNDGKYLAVITNNGLWIKDIVGDKINIINSLKIDENFLQETFITQFDEDFNILRNISSDKIDIKDKLWKIYNAEIFENNLVSKKNELEILTNFDYDQIQNLFSDLSSLSLLELIDLKNNYLKLNYSTTEINIQINKVVSYPLYLTIMTILASTIMLNTKAFKSSTVKITFGLFLSVVIYYFNNFFNVLGNTEKIDLIYSVWLPLIFLTFINLIMINKINEK